MGAQAWVALILGVIAILSALYGGVRFIVKALLAELLPDGNGGHNLRGRVDRIEAQVDRIYELLIEAKLSR